MDSNFLPHVSVYLQSLGGKEVHHPQAGLVYEFSKFLIKPVSLQELVQAKAEHWQEIKFSLKENILFLWEDEWHNKRSSIEARIQVLLGNFTTIHARETSIHEVSKEIQEKFLTENHFNIFINMPIRYGLYHLGELVALASFSKPLKWQKEKGIYESLEFARYASKQGIIVSGGIGKLLQYAIDKWNPHDVMTYIDLDWSDGKGFEKLGFEKISYTKPVSFYVHEKNFERIHASRFRQTLDENWKLVYNTGSLKMVKYLRTL